jgi:adenosylmethionine-8-amino-7-oxononanoate aminotransferase
MHTVSPIRGHATVCAVAETNLDILEKEHLLERAEKLELTLHHELDSLNDLDAVEDTRVAGFLGGVSLRADLDAPAIADDLVERATSSAHCETTRSS